MNYKLFQVEAVFVSISGLCQGCDIRHACRGLCHGCDVRDACRGLCQGCDVRDARRVCQHAPRPPRRPDVPDDPGHQVPHLPRPHAGQEVS